MNHNSAVAQGSGLISIPLASGELVLGSTVTGTNAANADLDEFYSFDYFLSINNVQLYYQMVGCTASLGPISDDEIAAREQHSREMASIRSLGNVYDPNSAAPCSPGGPVYITNVTAALQTNGLSSVQFDIYGGVNGILYDIISTTNLTCSPPNYTWTWAGQGLTCSSVLLTNEPRDQAFYILEQPSQTITIALGDNFEGQCNVPTNLTNAVAVAAGGFFSLAMRSDGTVIGWGENTYGETNIPTGLSNAVSIAAGYYHGLALLTNGAVTNWGSYYDGTNYYTVTNYSVASRPPTSNVVAIAAGQEHDLALLSNGTVVSWGLPWADANWVPVSLTNIQAIACGWYFNSALFSNGVVTNWGDSIYGLTTVPGNLTNAVAISANGYLSMALRTNGTVEAWGIPYYGATNVPAGLSNVVAISAGDYYQGLALQVNGSVVAWGPGFPFNIPPGVSGVKAISTGILHNLLIESGWSPVITAEPTNQYTVEGGTVTFSAQEQSLAEMQYQWQLNGVNLSGETNATLTLTNVQATDEGSYELIVSNGSGALAAGPGIFTLVLPPQIDYTYTSPGTSSTIWCVPSTGGFNADVTNVYPSPYYYYSQWQLNGTNIPGSQSIGGIISYNPTNDGDYAVVITNAAGSTNLTWSVLLAAPGMVEAWGSDTNGECDRPATLTNAAAIAAGDYHSVAVTDSGTILQWGEYSDGNNFYTVGSPPSLTNAVAVAASLGYDLALKADGTVTNWGLTNDVANFVPTNLPPAKAIAAGWRHNLALLTNGAVFGWGSNSNGQTTIPSDLTNANAATAIAAGELFSLALRANGTVEGWGDNTYGQTNVPAGLSNIVAIAAGGQHCLALISNGIVVSWGNNGFNQTNVPPGMSNVMAIAAGTAHSLALKNDGTLIAWGDNNNGQTNIPGEQPATVITSSGGLSPFYQTNTYPPIVVKLVAAGGNHSMAAIYSPLVQYPVDVSKDLLLIYNTNSTDSSNVCAYYLANRPMVSNANVLGIGCLTNEQTTYEEWSTNIEPQIQNWLALNPTKRPSYVVLFQDIPSRPDSDCGCGSLQWLINTSCSTNWSPFVSSINMNGAGGTNDCIAYITKIAFIGSNYSSGQLIISANAGGSGGTNCYGNTNWYFDDARDPYPESPLGMEAVEGVEANGVLSAAVTYRPVTSETPIIQGTNVAGYFSWGVNEGLPATYPIDGTIQFYQNSGWYLIETGESYNGDRITPQGNFLEWFASDAFGGSNYSNTPVGAISNVEEPQVYIRA